MKLLFVDNSADLQQKWIDPLRAEGWGALRARSSEDADRMLMLHGDSIEVVIISETLVRWAETHDYAFVVLTRTWAEKDVLKHQNSNRSAFYYQAFEGRVQDLQTAIHSYRSGGPVGAKNENTQWSATKTIALEDFTGVLTKPEVTKTNTEYSIKLDAPSVLFGGEAAPAESAAPAEAVEKTTIRAAAPITLQSDEESKVQATAVQSKAEPTRSEALPEVMEVKLDLDDSVRTDAAEATRISTNALHAAKSAGKPAEQRSADSTIVLESTKLELGSDIEEAGETSQIDIQAQEQELLDEQSINETVAFKDAVGGSVSQAGHSSHHSTHSASVVSHASPLPPPPPVVRVIEGDEALKNYLSLREQDVAVLTGQVRSSQERIHQLEQQLKVEKARGTELQHIVQKQEQQLKNYDNDKKVEVEVLYRQVEDLNLQLQERTNKAHTIEAKLKITTDEVNKVKERVRVDIRRIRVREKELESQLEILKKDSTALLQARDEKILELKRKLDLLEFNMELIQEQYSKERQSAEDLRNRLKDAAKAMRQAGGLLEQ